MTRRSLLAVPLLALPAAVQREYDVPFVGTPPAIVAAMLGLAELTPDDLLFDLGSGDGRIALTAGRAGARAIGIEIDPALVRRATLQARAEGLEGRVRFRRDDLFRVAIREASVVTLYLLPAVNLRLRPRLLTELAPGTRVVSHAFDMGDWRADTHRVVDGRNIYLWIIPAVAGGLWRLTEAGGQVRTLSIEQRFQDVAGTLDGVAIVGATLSGTRIAFSVGRHRYAGTVGERTIDGDGWRADRDDVDASPAAPSS